MVDGCFWEASASSPTTTRNDQNLRLLLPRIVPGHMLLFDENTIPRRHDVVRLSKGDLDSASDAVGERLGTGANR